MKRWFTCAFAALLFVLGACGSSSNDGGHTAPAPTTTTSANPTPTTSSPPPTTMPPPSDSNTPPGMPMPSMDATLSDLSPNLGALIPAFTPLKKSYTVRVPNGTKTLTLTPTAASAKASLTLNGAALASGKASSELALPSDGSAFTVTIVVTAEDGVTKLTYTLQVLLQPIPNGITVHSVGDSTMANYDPTVSPNQRGWMQMFPEFASNVHVDNAAINGTSSKSYYNSAWSLVRNRIAPGDYVFIQFAHNDETDDGIAGTDGVGTAAFGEFHDYLTKYVNESRALGAIPILFTPIVRLNWNGAQISAIGQHDLTGNGTAVGDANYPEAMRDVATKTSTPLVDMTASTKATAEQYGPIDAKAILYIATDNTHLQVMGATVYAQLAVQGLIAQNILKDALNPVLGLLPNQIDLDFGQRYLGASTNRAFSVLGLGLAPAAGVLTVSASDGFLVGTDPAALTASITIPYQRGALPPTTLYTSFSALTAGNVNGELTLSTDGGTHTSVSLEASGITPPAGATDASVVYALDSTTSAGTCVTVGGVSCTAEQLVGLRVQDYAPLTVLLPMPTPVQVQRIDLVNAADTWPAETGANAGRYAEFAAQPGAGKSFAVDTVSFYAGSVAGSTLAFTAQASTHADFSEPTDLIAAPNNGTNVLGFFAAAPNLTVADGQTLHVRIFPYSTSVAIKKYLGLQNVTVHGVAY